MKFTLGSVKLDEESAVPNDFKILRRMTIGNDEFYISYYGTVLNQEKFNEIVKSNSGFR